MIRFLSPVCCYGAFLYLLYLIWRSVRIVLIYGRVNVFLISLCLVLVMQVFYKVYTFSVVFYWLGEVGESVFRVDSTHYYLLL